MLLPLIQINFQFHITNNTPFLIPPKILIFSLTMEFETKVGDEEDHHHHHLLPTHQQPTFFSDHHSNYMKPYTKDEFLFEPPLSKGTFLQDFNLLDDNHHFHGHHGPSSNLIFGVQTPCYDPFDAYTSYGCSTNFDFYESKPLISEINNGHGHVMDNFQSGEYMNLHHHHHHHHHLQLGNVVDHMNQSSNVGFDYPLVKPMNFIVPDEVSCVSAEDDYYKKADMQKNRVFPWKKTWKTRKRNTIVKGQWTIEEDR